ncbi:MAG: hypothetical protein ABI831_11560, partial [Betaproteobacteria bacterium]
MAGVSNSRRITPDSGHGLRCERGTTLVELMIGITIGLLVLATLAALFASSSDARNEIDRSGQQIENGRFALELLRDDVHHAGYFGGFIGGAPQPAEACVPRSGLPLSAAALGWQSTPARTPLPVQGYAWGDTPPAETCIANQQPETDVLILRSVEPVTMSSGAVGTSAFDNDYFIQTSTCADAAIDALDKLFVVAVGGPGAATRFPLHQKDCATIASL